LFSSPSEAVNLLIDKGDMTAQEFYMIGSNLITYLRMDGNGDGHIGTADLLLFLGAYGEEPSPSEEALTQSGLVGAGALSGTATSLECVQYLLANRQMTVAEYNSLAVHVKPRVRYNFDNLGAVSALDLTTFLSAYSGDSGSSDALFLPEQLALTQ
jgi:hypothetical protein